MGRSGYTEDGEIDALEFGRWRGRVASAIRGKRGQAFLTELVTSLDAMPEPKRLIKGDLRLGGEVCALGSIGRSRGLDLEAFDPEDHAGLAEDLGVAAILVQEVEWVNDEAVWSETREERWRRVREWAAGKIAAAGASGGGGG
jgi:hypothetical protein